MIAEQITTYPVRRHDKRSSRTRRALTDALFKLLEKSEFCKITVNDICAKAEVSRPTFYTYFDDKYSLLSYCIEVFYEDSLNEATERGGSHRDILTVFLEHVQQCHKTFRSLLLGETNRELSSLVSNAFYQLNVNALSKKKEYGWLERIPIPVNALFRAGGTVVMLGWWLESGQHIDVPELVEYLLELNGSEESIFVARAETI